MNEFTIRERLRAALGDSSYPPDLANRAAARLGHAAEQRQPTTWALAVVAAVLAIALVATIVFGSHFLKERASVPVLPPPTQAPSLAGCANYSQVNAPPSLVKMTSPITGWAQGGLRTTDGGAHWRNTSPKASLDGMPSEAVANGLYPPGFSDFYLDGSHAWEIRSYSSSTLCYDHAGVFATTDGGRTWRRSADIPLITQSGWIANMQLQFLDALNGWLWVQIGPCNSPDRLFCQSTEGTLFGTTDGGLHWKFVSRITPSVLGFRASANCPSPFGGDIVFASSNTAWMQTTCQTSSPELLTSGDGGITWSIKRLPKPSAAGSCPCWVEVPRFFDASHGVVEVNTNVDPMVPHGPALLATSDGGLSWRPLPPMPATGYTLIMDFVDATSWWAIVTEPGWQKGSPTNDWLYQTTDGGQTWVLVQKDLPMGYPVDEIAFFNATHGLVLQAQNSTSGSTLGPGTEILTTSDGGHTWTTVIAQMSP